MNDFVSLDPSECHSAGVNDPKTFIHSGRMSKLTAPVNSRAGQLTELRSSTLSPAATVARKPAVAAPTEVASSRIPITARQVLS